MGTAKMGRNAQRMLANIGCERIENEEFTFKGVRVLLHNRAIECLNDQAREFEERLQKETAE